MVSKLVPTVAEEGHNIFLYIKQWMEKDIEGAVFVYPVTLPIWYI